jgi:hypothetical protein
MKAAGNAQTSPALHIHTHTHTHALRLACLKCGDEPRKSDEPRKAKGAGASVFEREAWESGKRT